ncbi:hypothetical protein JB92DRAFT_3129305 [Gautieria morchelliformis]|nr:hypothetical protein JB92DRAFT_3129305 [Gautieria morchelliformis]
MKLTDFDLAFQPTTHLGCRYYLVIFGTNDPFPLEQDMDRFLWEAWQIACTEYDVKLGPTPEVFTLRGSHVRGEAKRNARPLITVHYKFDASEDTAYEEEIATLVRVLTLNNSLIYELRHHTSALAVYR